ncbi:hypothetical protein [Aromatoleum diolicum]|uniref:Glycosyl hydrolase family 57 n=1 Tax=Aromatoleum diolicum TaxID=75796 RepID=A0ABX1QC82_9RHOO|nr:hypothetical protein [Aromatoleum diolicum]NMG75998.1 hypothetical protein [Aromatoleum diolicum]
MFRRVLADHFLRSETEVSHVTFVVLLLMLWLVLAVALLVARHGRLLHELWREPMIERPVLIVESDDWGPGPAEDARILREITGILARIRDRDGHPAVMTLGVVLGIPDAAAILASGGAEYTRRTLAETEFTPVVDAIRGGCVAGVFALQRHGLEHFWPQVLIARLREDDALRAWLGDPLMRSETLPAEIQSRWVDAARLPSRALPSDDIERAVREETELFRRIFGEAPEVAVPNTFVWDETVERAWAASGVRCVVTPGCRFEQRREGGGLAAATRRIRNGQRGAGGMTYVVRNDYFEPIRGHRAERVWQAVARRSAQARPTLLETHRESFIDGPDRVRMALEELESALRGAQSRHPDLCFMSTAELARHLADPASRLLARRLPVRIRVWLCRLRAELASARLLKATGLMLPLRATEWGLGILTRQRVVRLDQT